MDLKRHGGFHHERGQRHFRKENTGQAEYLNNLALKRDAMIEQEQMRLAQALSRLGIHSSLNKDHSYRLGMNGGYTHSSLSPSERTSMATTIEKFQHMRQKQQQQHHHLLLTQLLPVQGRQIFPRNLETSGSKHRHNVNKNKTVADGSVDFGTSTYSSSVLETEEITQKAKMKSKKSTKQLRNIAGDLLPQQYFQDPNSNHLRKVRPKIQDTGRPTVGSQSSHDNFSLVSSQGSVYYLPVMNHEGGQSLWHPGITALEDEYPDNNSTQTRRINTRRKNHRLDRTVDDLSPHDDMLEKHIQEQIYKDKMNKSRQMRTSLILPSIIEHQSLEVVCCKCIALEKKQQSTRLISKSTGDLPEKTSLFSQTNRHSSNTNSGDQAMKQPRVESEQALEKFLKKSNIQCAEDTSDEDDQDLIVTSLPTISQSQGFTQRFGRGNIKRFYGSENPRNGLKLHANLADNVERSFEINNLDSCPETDRGRPRKINIVIDIPDTQSIPTTPDIERPLSVITPDIDRQQ